MNLPVGLYWEDIDERGFIIIQKHVHRQMVVVLWKDSKLVTLLSTAAPPYTLDVAVLRRLVSLCGLLLVPSSPMYKQYVEHICRVDIID